ncbi:MAG: chloride channel protein [Acidobacteriota bacterium]|nr:chloride channel protein [Acidobacteriota bacterium]
MFKEKWRLFVDTILLGVIGGLSAQVFMCLLRLFDDLFLRRLAGYQAPGLPGEGGTLTQVIGPHHLWLVPVACTLGGLISGLLVYGIAPEAEGHGTDTAVRAYHRSGGFIRLRVPPLKMLTSAITIGSGGAAGREGPTALISAGFGSIYATLTRRSDADRRLLVLIGMAAGLSAIFRSPIGTALFAVEVLYNGMDFESDALIYTMIASVVAYAVNGLFVGWAPLFSVPALAPTSFVDYFWYLVLGLACGVMAALVPVVFYRLRDAFHRLPGPPHVKPALGGLALGLLALQLPQVLGGGYGWIQLAIDGRLAVDLMLALAFAKLLAFALTVSSGGSGGVFAPTLYVGAMLGGVLGRLLHQPAAAFVVVGMAATFGGAARVPIATLWMVTEMTGGYKLLVPAALAVMFSAIVQSLLSGHLRLKYISLYEAQVASPADSPVHTTEYLNVALRLLERHKIRLPASLDPVNLRDILAAGLPVDLPDGRQFVLGAVPPGSPLLGRPADRAFEEVPESSVAAAFRAGQTLLAHGGVTLRAGDRLLVLAPAALCDRIRRRLAPPVPV